MGTTLSSWCTLGMNKFCDIIALFRRLIGDKQTLTSLKTYKTDHNEHHPVTKQDQHFPGIITIHGRFPSGVTPKMSWKGL